VADLWDEFHRVVNMTSRELSEWLRVNAADDQTEELPDRAGPPTGRHVLEILRKRKVDLTDGDERVMREVVDRVYAERPDDLDPVVRRGQDQEDWRHRLMSIGHDPLKESR